MQQKTVAKANKKIDITRRRNENFIHHHFVSLKYKSTRVEI